jgi:hypothetical protein
MKQKLIYQRIELKFKPNKMKFKQFLIENSKDETQDEFENLASVLRQMARRSGFQSFNISTEEDHFLVEITLNNEEKLSKIFSMFEFIRKIKKNYLTGSSCDMDLWENKRGQPIFTFEFYYKSETYSPKYDYDDGFPF